MQPALGVAEEAHPEDGCGAAPDVRHEDLAAPGEIGQAGGVRLAELGGPDRLDLAGFPGPHRRGGGRDAARGRELEGQHDGEDRKPGDERSRASRPHDGTLPGTLPRFRTTRDTASPLTVACSPIPKLRWSIDPSGRRALVQGFEDRADYSRGSPYAHRSTSVGNLRRAGEAEPEGCQNSIRLVTSTFREHPRPVIMSVLYACSEACSAFRRSRPGAVSGPVVRHRPGPPLPTLPLRRWPGGPEPPTRSRPPGGCPGCPLSSSPSGPGSPRGMGLPMVADPDEPGGLGPSAPAPPTRSSGGGSRPGPADLEFGPSWIRGSPIERKLRLLQQAVRGQELPGHCGHILPVDHDLPDELGHVLGGEPGAHRIEQPPNLVVQLVRANHGRDVLRVLEVLVVHERDESVLPDARVRGEQQADLHLVLLECGDGLRPTRIQRFEVLEEDPVDPLQSREAERALGAFRRAAER